MELMNVGRKYLIHLHYICFGISVNRGFLCVTANKKTEVYVLLSSLPGYSYPMKS